MYVLVIICKIFFKKSKSCHIVFNTALLAIQPLVWSLDVVINNKNFPVLQPVNIGQMWNFIPQSNSFCFQLKKLKLPQILIYRKRPNRKLAPMRCPRTKCTVRSNPVGLTNCYQFGCYLLLWFFFDTDDQELTGVFSC